MSLVKYRPLRLFNNDFDKVFRQRVHQEVQTMPIDILESDDAYQVVANLPGFKKDQIAIEINPADRFLIVTAEIVENKKEEEEKEVEENTFKYLYRERKASKSSRRVNFKQPLDTEKAVTTFKNGVLTILLPKSEEAKAIKLTIN